MKIVYSDFDGAARTDGENIFINSKYSGSSLEKFFIFHEEGHILLNHFKRRGNRDLQLWNIATDLEIAIYLYPLQNFKYPQYRNGVNTIIHCRDLNEAVQKVEELNGFVYWKDKEYESMGVKGYQTAEEIYEILKQKSTDSTEDSSDNNKDKQKIDRDITTCFSIHGSEEFKEDSSMMTETEDLKEAENSIKEAVKVCQAYLEQKVKKLKINSAITNSIASTGRGSLSFRKTYSRPCRSKAGINTDRLYRGERVVETKTDVFLFVDRSGSFTSEKTKLQEEAVKDLVKRFRGKLRVKTLYFTTNVFEDEKSVKEKGTNIFSCLQYIERYQPSMSIIITDNDPCVGLGYLNLKKSKVGFIFIGCNQNAHATAMVKRFNGTLVNSTN